MRQKKDSKKHLFIGAQLIRESISPLGHHLLLGYSDFFNKSVSFSDCGIISIGTPNKSVLSKNTCICLSDEADIYEVFSEIQKIFMKFNMWDNELTKSTFTNMSLEEICTLSIPIFNNPIFIHNTYSEILTSVNEMPGLFAWDYDSNPGKRSLPTDIMNDFKVSPKYQETMRATGPQMFSEEQFGYRILYINLWFEEQYLARICVSELGREIRQGDYELLEYLANHVLISLRQGNINLSNISNELKKSLIELLDFRNTDEAVLTERLASFGWKIDDGYFCINIFLEDRDHSTYAVEYTCNRLENMFPFCCVFLYHDCILVVVNTCNNDITKNDFLSRLSVFLREGLFKSSISSLGHDFRNIWYYYKQTIIAYKIGCRKNPFSWKYNFNDYVFPYFFEQASSELTPMMLCEPHLQDLYLYDQTHQTEYFKTLRVFLENERNVVHSSNMLFVHRSTFLYRLNKIKSILKVNLDNPQVRLHIMISFELFDMNAK